MKKLILIFLLIVSSIVARELIDPSKFDGSNKMKKEVIVYIQENTKQTYKKIGMNDATTLRAMEEVDLNAFKELTKVKDITLLHRTIKTYCNIGMCDYQTILNMYQEEKKASKKELKW